MDIHCSGLFSHHVKFYVLCLCTRFPPVRFVQIVSTRYLNLTTPKLRQQSWSPLQLLRLESHNALCPHFPAHEHGMTLGGKETTAAYQDGHSDHVVGCYSLLVDSQSMVGWQIINTFLVKITADTSFDCHSINQPTLDQYSNCYAD